MALALVQPSPFALLWADVDSTLREAEYGEWVGDTGLGVRQPVVQPGSCSTSATQSPSLYLERIVTPRGRRLQCPQTCRATSVSASHGCWAGKVRQSWGLMSKQEEENISPPFFQDTSAEATLGSMFPLGRETPAWLVGVLSNSDFHRFLNFFPQFCLYKKYFIFISSNFLKLSDAKFEWNLQIQRINEWFMESQRNPLDANLSLQRSIMGSH